MSGAVTPSLNEPVAPSRNYYNIDSFKHFAIPNAPSTTKHSKSKSMSIVGNSGNVSDSKRKF